ncbi:hypothetical protein ACW4TU_45240 (plasmid) [Streptomyces sp. QTS52]
MTAHRGKPGPGGPIDRELAQRHEAFTAKLEAALDVEAGLRDILFQSRHETFTAKVETALDVEAGLRDILTHPTIQAPPGHSPAVAPPVSSTTPGNSGGQARPAQRLKLRSNPRVRAARRALRVVESWTRNSDLDLDLDLAGARTRALDRARTRNPDLDCDPDCDLDFDFDFARDLDLDFTRALDLALAFDVALDLDCAPGRARALDRILDRAHDLLNDLVYDLRLADVIARHTLARVLTAALTAALARALDLARALTAALDCTRERARDLAPARVDALARDLTRADALARDLARALTAALDLALDAARSRCLQIISDEYTQAVGTSVAVDEESLASLMDDFTTDDLSDADMREGDIELTGVRWSDGTTWPASTNIDRLKRRSDRQEDGSWIIRAGTGNARENILT